MTTCIELAVVIVLAVFAYEVRELRVALTRMAREEASYVEHGPPAIIDPGPAEIPSTLPPILGDDIEARIEDDDRDTKGAVSDYRVCGFWYEQDERDYEDEIALRKAVHDA